jgi:hypothetical protein
MGTVYQGLKSRKQVNYCTLNYNFRNAGQRVD